MLAKQRFLGGSYPVIIFLSVSQICVIFTSDHNLMLSVQYELPDFYSTEQFEDFYSVFYIIFQSRSGLIKNHKYS